MLADPRRGLAVALAVVAAACGWFLALAVAGDALFARFGMNMHAITFLAIFAALAGAAVAWIFARFARVRADLLAGRDAPARWRVDPARLAGFAPQALAADDADKRGALMVILAFTAVIFGAFALADPDVAPVMLSVAAGLAAIVGLAYLFGRRTARKHLQFRGGEAIVGPRGLIFNGVLHVWDVPLTRLEGARIDARRQELHVGYAFLTRAGFQSVGVALPFPPQARAEAERAAARLDAIAAGEAD